MVLGWGYAVRLARDVGARDIRGKARSWACAVAGAPVLTERPHWIPACAGMTDPKAVPAERLRWIPACAGMTDRGAVPAERMRWIPACAGMTDHRGAVPAERLHWIPACAGGVVAWVGTDVGACAATDRGCRSRLHPLVIPAKAGIQDAAVGVALRLLSGTVYAARAGAQPVVAATGSGAVPAERLRWIPACAGMTDPKAVPAERLRWSPACAGMTDPEAVPAERLHWIPACAGMTDPEAVPAERLRWIPACAGMTDRGAVPAERMRWIPACAGMTDHRGAVPAERLHWIPACAGGVVAWVGTDVGACAATDRGCRSRLHPLVIPAKAGIQDAAVGVALRLLSGTVYAARAGAQPVVAATGSGAVPAERLRWIPACAGMTDPKAVPAERLRWSPACAGMTDPEAVPAERLHWIPACAGMTDRGAVLAQRLHWIPACAGMADPGYWPSPIAGIRARAWVSGVCRWVVMRSRGSRRAPACR